MTPTQAVPAAAKTGTRVLLRQAGCLAIVNTVFELVRRPVGPVDYNLASYLC